MPAISGRWESVSGSVSFRVSRPPAASKLSPYLRWSPGGYRVLPPWDDLRSPGKSCFFVIEDQYADSGFDRLIFLFFPFPFFPLILFSSPSFPLLRSLSAFFFRFFLSSVSLFSSFSLSFPCFPLLFLFPLFLLFFSVFLPFFLFFSLSAVSSFFLFSPADFWMFSLSYPFTFLSPGLFWSSCFPVFSSFPSAALFLRSLLWPFTFLLRGLLGCPFFLFSFLLFRGFFASCSFSPLLYPL